MKRTIILLFCLLFSLSMVCALPVTYEGNVLVNNATGSNVVLKTVSSLEEVTETVNNTYVINIAGSEDSNTSFYIFGELVETTVQPVQSSKVTLDLSFDTKTDGTSCSYNEACTGGHCVNKDVVGICSAEEYYCDKDRLCDSDYGETIGNCGTDCKRASSSSGGGYTNYGYKTPVEDPDVLDFLIGSVDPDGSSDDYDVVAIGSGKETESNHSVDDLIKVLSELTDPEKANQTTYLLTSSEGLTVTKTIQKYEITNKKTGKVTKKTMVTLTVTSKKDGQTIVIVEVVPKGVANSADLLEFFGVTSEILESDPIVQWMFTDTIAGDTYNVDYAVKGLLNKVDSKTYAVESDLITPPHTEEPINETEEPEVIIVGGDKDEFGCIPSAGYTWCEPSQKCLREWEEPCEEIKGEVTAEWVTPPEPKVVADNATYWRTIIIMIIVVGLIIYIIYTLISGVFKKPKQSMEDDKNE